MKFTRRSMLTAIGIGLIAGAVPLSAIAQSIESIKAAGEIKIGVLVDFPPYGLMNAENQPDGFDIEVARQIAEGLGVKAQIVPVTGPNRIPYLQSNQIDLVIASLSITDERKKSIYFSQPYSGLTIAVYGPVGMDVAKPTDLSGKSIAVARASTQDIGVTKIAPLDAKIQRFDDDASAVQALLSGQVDLIGISSVGGMQIEKAAPGRYDQKLKINEQANAIGLRKGSDELLSVLNSVIDKLKSDGELEKLHQKWFMEPIPARILSAKN